MQEVAPRLTLVFRPAFYVTFWQLSSYDLYFPVEKYTETEKALVAAGESCSNKYREAERSTDRAKRTQANQFRGQRQRYADACKALKTERATQESVFKYTTDPKGRLEREKAHWFSHGKL